jgi:hypothetical protein
MKAEHICHMAYFWSRLCSRVPPARDQTARGRCPHPPPPGWEARTVPTVRPLVEPAPSRVPNAPSTLGLCRAYREAHSSGAHLSPARVFLYVLRTIPKVHLRFFWSSPGSLCCPHPLHYTIATAHMPHLQSSNCFCVRLALNCLQFVVPVKLNGSVLEPHVHRHVIRMTIRLSYSANAPLPSPLCSIQHSHQHTNTCLMRLQEDCLLVVYSLGPDPYSGGNTGSDPNRAPFPSEGVSTFLHLFMYREVHRVQQHADNLRIP